MKALASLALTSGYLISIALGFCYGVTPLANLATFYIWLEIPAALLAALVLFGYSSFPAEAQINLAKSMRYRGHKAATNFSRIGSIVGVVILAATGHFMLAGASAFTGGLMFSAISYFMEKTES